MKSKQIKQIEKELEKEMKILKDHVDRVLIRLTNKIIKIKNE